MKPQNIFGLVALTNSTMARIVNPELQGILGQYEAPDTVKPLTRCQVKRLQSLLKEEVESDPEFRSFVASNKSLPVEIELVPSEAIESKEDEEPRDFDVFIGDLDRRIEAMLDDFYGPASDDSC